MNTRPTLLQKHFLTLSMIVTALACAAAASAGVPLTYSQNFKPSPNPVRAPINWGPNYYLAFSDPNSYTNPTFTLVSAPTNGLLEYRSDLCNGQWLPVLLNTPISNNTVNFPLINLCSTFNNCKWSYTCTNGAMASVGCTDSFTWRMANNEGNSTNFGGATLATCYITVTTNQPPTAFDIYRSCAPGTDTTFAVEFYDTDAQLWNTRISCGQAWKAAVVTPPLHGTISATNGLRFTYTASPASTAKWDSFTYKINDTVEDSNTATATIQLRDPGTRASNLVILVVNDTLLQPSSLSNEVYRLRDDLVHEGYTSRVKSWHNAGTVPSNLWAYLVSEYTNTTQFLAGAILIGELPRATVTNTIGTTLYTDFVYWNLQSFQATNALLNCSPRNIWVSRIIAPDTTYGSELTLLRRALDANHDYRTGASRLPHRAFLYETAVKSMGAEDSNAVNRLKEVWPEADCRGGPSGTNKWFVTDRPELRHFLNSDGYAYDGAGADCMVVGGEWFEEVSDGLQGGLLLGDGLITTAGLHYYLNQIRFHVYMSCDDGVYGGYANNTLFTRGGGCVFTLGFSHTAGVGAPQISDCSTEDALFRNLIKAGESIGSAAVQYFAFSSQNNYIAMFYGDMSLGVMASPSNSLPVILSVTNSVSPGHSPVQMNLSVNAYDPDGTISNIEWFPLGFDYGRTNPAFSGTATSISYAYPAPGVYTSRVEVVDNYKARAWRETVVTVAAPTACTIVATASIGGNISPSGNVVLCLGSTNSFTNTQSQWYHASSVIVDGADAGVPGVYTFTNVVSDHSITAQFAPDLAASNTPKCWLVQANPDWTNDFNAAETNDMDHDGMPAWQEYIAGTDPTSQTSALSIGITFSNGLPVITVPTISPGPLYGALKRYYRLQSKADLLSGQWIDVESSTNIQASGQPEVFTNLPSSSNVFFRCRAWLGL